MTWNPYQTLLSRIDEHTTIITPNRRLSATLHKLYRDQQLAQKKLAWHTPDILPAISWIECLWQSFVSQPTNHAPILLNTLQENYLWEKIVAKETENTPLLQLSETANTAKSAWTLMNEWQVDLNHPAFSSTEDYAAFKRFAEKFIAYCQQEKVIDHATITKVITHHLSSLTIAKQLFVVGFTEVSPQLTHLLSSCKAAGSTVHFIQLAHETPVCYQVALADKDTELLTMARVAKQYHDEDPTLSVGIVIPGLDKMRDRVEHAFTAVFDNEAAFNISAGKSLTHYPVIQAAFKMLHLYKNKLSIETLSYLLNSPFLGDAEFERSQRASMDLLLRQGNRHTVSLPALLPSLSSRCPQLAKRITAYLALQKNHSEKQSHTQWMQHVMALLTSLGWPGERSINSIEYQVIDSFMRLLENIGTLDTLDSSVTFSDSLHTLQKMAGKSVFQPKTPDTSIQVLGLLEALSLPFDYLWIAGMDDLSWPEQPQPNPFIPKSLQRELQMPRATALRELHYCEAMTAQLMQSASQTIFSYAKKEGELELNASPLIRDLPSITLDLSPYESVEEKIYASKQLDYLQDDKGPAITPDEKVTGGTSILKYQALCPFRAFAEWRLHAHELENPQMGLKAKERGTLLHKALELFWNTHQSQSALLALNEDELAQSIQTCVAEAMSTINESTNTEKYMQLEQQRLQQLITEWLALEKSRDPFTVIKSEKKVKITLGEIDFNIKIDRIDELENGKKLIIDYKTGKRNDINSWFSDRPEEPQLPLYSLTDTAQTIGITFAQIARGDTCFKGISQYVLPIDGIKLVSELKQTTALSWQDQLTQWQHTLTNLSHEFYQGVAAVDPKNPPDTCEWCALKPLCRINETLDIPA